MVTPAEHIEHLELKIDKLRVSIAHSRKLVLLGKSGAALGVLILTWWTVHAGIGVTWFLAGVAISLGGLVLAGASRSSTDELAAALRKTERDRDKAIDALQMRDVGQQEPE